MNYYNEIEPYAVDWLRNLIAAGLIPRGDVDDRSIRDVQASDLKGYTQAHFFCGIGLWPLALEWAKWPTTRPVFTGSCPCQPYSTAGRGKAEDDPRNLWPEFLRLITECNPPTVFGEQTQSQLGRYWLSGVRNNLEALGYGVGAADLSAAVSGSPMARQRLYWVADSPNIGHERGGAARGRGHGFEDSGTDRRMGDPDDQRLERLTGAVNKGNESGRIEEDTSRPTSKASAASPWSDAVFIKCTDGKSRLASAQPSLFPLVDGDTFGVVEGSSDKIPRTATLKAIGNAIVPAVGALFVKSFMEAE